MAEMVQCSECCSEIDARAKVCPVCHERLQGVQCHNCLAKNPEGAKLCRWCSTKLQSAKKRSSFQPFQVRSDALGYFLVNQSFFPQEAKFTEEKLVITTYGFLALTSSEEQIPWEKVAGFNVVKGYFWNSVAIETRGQSTAIIHCLSRKDSDTVREVLESMEL